MHLSLWVSIHSRNDYRILRRILKVMGYMEMCSTCNLVNMQIMCGIYIKCRHPYAHHNVSDIHDFLSYTLRLLSGYGAYCRVAEDFGQTMHYVLTIHLKSWILSTDVTLYEGPHSMMFGV